MGKPKKKGPGGFYVTLWTVLVHSEPAKARAEIQHALDEAGGNVTEAARAAGCSRQSLHSYMNRLGISSPRRDAKGMRR